jgi:subtilisin family serine protease
LHRDHQQLDAPQADGAEAEGGNEQVITRPVWTLAVSQSSVAVSLTFDELVAAALPLTPWWERNTAKPDAAKTKRAKGRDKPPTHLKSEDSDEVRWMRQIVGIIALASRVQSTSAPVEVDLNAPWFGNAAHDVEELTDDLETRPLDADPAQSSKRATFGDYQKFRGCVRNEKGQSAEFARLEAKAFDLARGATAPPKGEPPLLWSISLNRRARPAIRLSVSATKADAARLLFNVKCKDLTWAIVDTGIDATHPAFGAPKDDAVLLAAPQKGAKKKGQPARQNEVGARITKTYDFTRLRLWTTLDSHPSTGPSELHQAEDLEEADRRFKQMRRRLRSGQQLDWPSLEPLLRVSHEDGQYERPGHDHGTHVAGILGGAKINDTDGQGMCPDINLIDLRVLDDDGKGDEFSIIAALQFIRYLNATSDQPVIHGVNLSLSLLHDVENYACGRTPICDECERLVASGVVVVAAAGNRGFERVLTGAGELDAYRAISITDPGNAEGVITVGATHRFQPHTYGVSYFSSRGPTGDGRIKPDVLAPGERIYSCVFDKKYDAKDGTSMAAPHVSGVAALLMARHREFVNQPARVKKIICSTATDLGRERYFQGSGMVDALRALQSV